MTSFDNYTTEQLETMLEAGFEVLESHYVLAKTGDTIVGELLPEEEEFREWRHCPPGDIIDKDTHSQFYYHAHRDGEHGHFHLFMRKDGMPKNCRPVDRPEAEYLKDEGVIMCHLVAISMDEHGIPIRLFTTNRWLTDEYWYRAKDISVMLDDFSIEQAKPSWPVNRWVTAMVKLFRPQIEQILLERDALVTELLKKQWQEELFEDRDRGILTEIKISVDDHMVELKKAMTARRRKASRKNRSGRRGTSSSHVPAQSPGSRKRKPRARQIGAGAGAAPP